MKRVLVLIALVCFPLLYVGAQTTAEIAGTVQDSSGAAVAGAQVQVTDVDTNAVRTTGTSVTGAYIFPSLPIGPYKLQVTKQGFVTYAQTGIVLQVNSNPEIDVTLQVGAVTQTVEVQANAAMVETESNAGLGQVIQPEQVVDLPLNGREATQLIALSGASVNTAGAGGLVNNLDYAGGTSLGAPVSFSVAGSQGNATNYYLDGSINMDFRTNVGLPLPFPDALQEFKVESSALAANSGSHPGGSVNAATKSGTNSFHGDAFDYLRNTVMDAYTDRFYNTTGFLGNPAPDNLKRNQFGGTIGGPIKKDKLFFFYGFQGTEERQLGNTVSVNIPTAAALAGNFTTLLSSTCLGAGKQVYLADAYVTAHDSNILKPGLYGTLAQGGNASSAVAAAFVAQLPESHLTDQNCGSYSYQLHTSDHEFQHIARVDWQRTQNDTLFFRYYFTNYTLLPSLQPGNILSGSAPGLADRIQSIDIGDTHILSPRMISSLRVSFTRTATVRTAPPGVETWTQLGSNVYSPIGNYTGQNAVTGYFSPTDPAFPGYDYENQYGISENIGWTIGSHQLNFGFSGMHIQMNDDGLFQVEANLTFSGGVTGNALADFITGNPSKLSQGGGQLGRDGQNIPSLYFQDNWKVKRNFQVNYGVRWDPFIPQHNKYREEADFSLAGYNAGTVSKEYVNAPPGITFPGDAGFNGDSPTVSHYYDFSPRIGIVWDPRGKGTETVRAGYGLFYDTSTLWNTMHIVLNPPWGETIGIVPATVAAGGGLANPWGGYAGGDPFPVGLNPPSTVTFPQAGTWIFENQNSHPSNSQQWNLALQKQFGGNWLLSATYLGSKTSHAWLGQNLDPSTIISAGMTAPGIVSTAGMTGTSGPCTLFYGGTNPLTNEVTFPVCNSLSTATALTNGGVSVANENARRALTLSNPTKGPFLAGGLVEDFSMGNSAYNGLLVSAQHRLSQNFSILTNFTWSHCLDDGEIGQDIGNAFQNPANRKADWGNCLNDRRRIFNLSMVVESPKYESHWVQVFAGNWQGSGIFTASSGSPLSLVTGGDVSLTGVGADRPDEVANPFVGGTVAANPTCTAPATVHTLQAWYNPCAFVPAPLGTYGTLGRNAITGPGNWNFDSAIWRIFPIKESVSLTFRAEAFNTFNHLQIGNPGASLESITQNGAGAFTQTRSSSAGFISSVAAGTNQRILQLALILKF